MGTLHYIRFGIFEIIGNIFVTALEVCGVYGFLITRWSCSKLSSSKQVKGFQ